MSLKFDGLSEYIDLPKVVVSGNPWVLNLPLHMGCAL